MSSGLRIGSNRALERSNGSSRPPSMQRWRLRGTDGGNFRLYTPDGAASGRGRHRAPSELVSRSLRAVRESHALCLSPPPTGEQRAKHRILDSLTLYVGGYWD